LFIGAAYDGPVAAPVAPTSIEEAFEIFGGYTYENQIVSATATGFTTTYDVYGPISFLQWDEADLVDFTDISGVAVSGNSVTFERIGTDQTFVIKYARGITTGSALVFKAFAETVTTTNTLPYLYRVGGTPASGQITSGGVGLQFTTIGAGALYNNASISISTTGLTLTQPAGKGPTYTFSTTGKTVEDLTDDINLYYMKGYGCVYCESVGSGSFTVTSGTYALTGGTDGSYTDQELITLFESLDLSGICAVSVLGRSFPISGDTGVLGDILTTEFLDDLPNPLMFVQNIAYVSGMTETDYVATITANKPLTHKNLMLAVGNGVYSNYIHAPYQDGISTSLAALIPYADNSLLWTTVGLSYITPLFSSAAITNLKTAGFATLGTHYTRSFPVVLSDVASDPDWNSRKYLAVMDTVATIRPYLETLVGLKQIEAELVKQNVLALLSVLPNLQEFDVAVTLYRSGLLSTQIVIRPYATIEAITFGISIKT
jgi:hypothetical protein